MLLAQRRLRESDLAAAGAPARSRPELFRGRPAVARDPRRPRRARAGGALARARRGAGRGRAATPGRAGAAIRSLAPPAERRRPAPPPPSSPPRHPRRTPRRPRSAVVDRAIRGTKRMARLDETRSADDLARAPRLASGRQRDSPEFRLRGLQGRHGLRHARGDLAEAANHHPDIQIRYEKVTLTLTSHDASGLTDRDFALAERSAREGPRRGGAGQLGRDSCPPRPRSRLGGGRTELDVTDDAAVGGSSAGCSPT